MVGNNSLPRHVVVEGRPKLLACADGSMPSNVILGSILFPSNHDDREEHNKSLLEHRGKRPCSNPWKTPQNRFSGTDVKPDLTVRSN
jgi:hypothetical protein